MPIQEAKLTILQKTGSHDVQELVTEVLSLREMLREAVGGPHRSGLYDLGHDAGSAPKGFDGTPRMRAQDIIASANALLDAPITAVRAGTADYERGARDERTRIESELWKVMETTPKDGLSGAMACVRGLVRLAKSVASLRESRGSVRGPSPSRPK